MTYRKLIPFWGALTYWVMAGVNCGPIPGPKLYIREDVDAVLAKRPNNTTGQMFGPALAGTCIVTMGGWLPETATVCTGLGSAEEACSTPAELYVLGDPVPNCLKYVPAIKP